jgi:RNA binding exosome subunit
MYEEILKNIIEDMANFGLISTITISYDIFNSMDKKQINHLEEFLDGNIKWLIRFDKENYYVFIYKENPRRNDE